MMMMMWDDDADDADDGGDDDGDDDDRERLQKCMLWFGQVSSDNWSAEKAGEKLKHSFLYKEGYSGALLQNMTNFQGF